MPPDQSALVQRLTAMEEAFDRGDRFSSDPQKDELRRTIMAQFHVPNIDLSQVNVLASPP